MKTERRNFIASSIAMMACMVAPRLLAETTTNNPESTKPKPVERVRPPRQDLSQVLRFVQAGHVDLPKVKEMLAQDPQFAISAWDWGQGDWETALGGASHVGRRDIAEYLLSHGARIDGFCAAMLGERDVVLALLKTNPSVATTKGPHGYTLLYHVAISGDIVMAEALKPLLAPNARDYNQALSAAARDGRLEMTQWLLQNGVTNPNVPDGFGKTAMDFAMEKNYPEIAAELHRRGVNPKN